jgi:hypothetical protein
MHGDVRYLKLINHEEKDCRSDLSIIFYKLNSFDNAWRIVASSSFYSISRLDV